MQVSYRFTKDDIDNYLSTNFPLKKKRISNIIFIIGITFLVITDLMFLIIKDYSYTLFFTFFIILLLALNKYIPKHMKKKYINKLKSTGLIEELTTIELKEDEITISSPSSTSTFKYSVIEKVSLIKNYFVLIEFKSGENIVIPGSAFSSNTEIIDFINQIKTKAKIL